MNPHQTSEPQVPPLWWDSLHLVEVKRSVHYDPQKAVCSSERPRRCDADEVGMHPVEQFADNITWTQAEKKTARRAFEKAFEL